MDGWATRCWAWCEYVCVGMWSPNLRVMVTNYRITCARFTLVQNGRRQPTTTTTEDRMVLYWMQGGESTQQYSLIWQRKKSVLIMLLSCNYCVGKRYDDDDQQRQEGCQVRLEALIFRNSYEKHGTTKDINWIWILCLEMGLVEFSMPCETIISTKDYPANETFTPGSTAAETWAYARKGCYVCLRFVNGIM